MESFAQEQLLSKYSFLPRSINGYRFTKLNWQTAGVQLHLFVSTGVDLENLEMTKVPEKVGAISNHSKTKR